MGSPRFALGDQEGFTLVELLVVILIVGILAAIAIPMFTNSVAAADGAPSKSLMQSAMLTAETAALDEPNGFAAISKKLLSTNEPTISTKKGDGPWVSKATGTIASYTLTVTSARTGNKFTLMRNADGSISRTCTIPKPTSPPGGCNVGSGKSGTW